MLGRAYRKCGRWTALFFFFGRLKMEQVLGRAYRKCGEWTALFFFLWGLNLVQVLGRAYRKCGEWTALFFFWRSEPGTGSRAESTENLECGPHFSFFWCLNLEQVLGRGDGNCGEWIALFLGSELGTGVLWRVDRTFLFFGGLNLEQVLGRAYRNCGESTAFFFSWVWTFFFSFFPFFFLFFFLFSLFFTLFHSLSLFFQFFTSFSLFLPLFHSFSNFLFLFPFFFSFFLFFLAFFHIFFPFTTFFTLFPFSPLFLLTFSHSFSHFRWPGRGRSLAALPCLPLPYLTLPLLSSPSLTPFFYKKGASRFSADFCAEKEVLAHQKSWSFQGLSTCLVVDVGYKLSFQMHHVCEMCVWSKHAPKSVQFFGDRCRSATLTSKAVIKLCVYAGPLERCVFVFLVFWWNRRRAVFFLLSPLWEFWHPALLGWIVPAFLRGQFCLSGDVWC